MIDVIMHYMDLDHGQLFDELIKYNIIGEIKVGTNTFSSSHNLLSMMDDIKCNSSTSF